MLNVELSTAIRNWRGLPRRRWCQYDEEWVLVTYPCLTSNPCHLANCNIIGPYRGLVWDRTPSLCSSFLLLPVMSALLTNRPFSSFTAMLDASRNHQVRLNVSLGGLHEETNDHPTLGSRGHRSPPSTPSSTLFTHLP